MWRGHVGAGPVANNLERKNQNRRLLTKRRENKFKTKRKSSGRCREEETKINKLPFRKSPEPRKKGHSGSCQGLKKSVFCSFGIAGAKFFFGGEIAVADAVPGSLPEGQKKKRRNTWKRKKTQNL